MKYLFFAFFIASFLACSQAPKNAESQQKSTAGVAFVFSKDPMVMDMRDPANWCVAHFAENALVNADPNNSKRRYFAMDNQPHKVVVDYLHFTASFILQRVGQQVEVFTSDNYPACLSNKANFFINPDGSSFRYDNKKHISFDVMLQEFPNGLQVSLDLPPDSGFGMLVNRCENCK